MGKIFMAAMTLAACVGLSCPDVQAKPPVEAFGMLPDMFEPQLSPDGKHFAAIQSYNGKPTAVIYQVHAPAGTTPVVIPSLDMTIDGLQWASNDHLLLRVKMNVKARNDDRLRTWVRLVSVKADGSDGHMLLKNYVTLDNNPYAAIVADYDLDDPHTIYMALFVPNVFTRSYQSAREEDDSFRFDLMKVDLETGDGHQYMSGNAHTREWLMDGHGHVVGRIDITRRPLVQHLKLYDGAWHNAGDFDASGAHDAGISGLTEDSQAFAMLHSTDGGTNALIRHDLKAAGKDTILFRDPDYDIADVLHNPWTNHVTGVSYARDKMEYVYFDPATEALQRGLEQAFPGLTVHMVSMSLDKQRAIVKAEGPRHPPVFYFLDRQTHEATPLLSSYPDLTADDLGEMSPYPYTARDGLKIPAYLTLPPGKAAKNLPVVVMPHGGPDARDVVGFDWWAQFLANRGYAVLQPNYRGSSGYGDKFTEAGLQQWGLKMQDDITDGVRKLIADGIADPKRICIVGASYGGYAALAGATFTPDLYACAMSFAGPSDLLQMLHTERSDYGEDSQTISFWISRIGSAYDDTARLHATSPADHADQVKCPILLMHGEGDTTVRINQSEIMYKALQDAHKDVRFVRFKGEDHYLNFSETRIRMLKALEAFLDQNIGH